MAFVVAVAALVLLALVTQAGVLALQRAYPQQGRMIEVAGATLQRARYRAARRGRPPIVMIHGASSNLETMRQPLGDRLAKNHRVILIDRPGHGWSTREHLEDSTPAIQGRMIDEALDKARRRAGDLRGAFLGRRAGRADGAGLSAARRRSGDAGAGRLSVARRRRLIQQDRHHAGDRSAARLHHHAAARLFPDRARRARRVPAADDAGWICREHRDAVAAASARISRQCLGSGDAEGGGRGTGAALCRDQGADRDHRGRRPTRRYPPTSIRVRSRPPRPTPG